MGSFVKNIRNVLVTAVIIPGLAFATQAPNPRSTTNNMKNAVRSINTDSNVSVRRSATTVIARSVAANSRKNNNTVARARSVVSRTPNNISARSGTNFVSNNATVSRVAISKTNATPRNTTNQSDNQILSRTAKSRATAVFDDVTKISNDYASCRDAYTTCMDQFCAVADDTYRRCFCNDKFATLRDTANNIDTALSLLVDFQNNNLNAIDKTAAEVTAMYSSTAGELAIKKDTSASQKMLDEIDDILSGKKKKKTSSSNSSMGIIDFGGLSDMGDLWTSGSSSVFNSRASDGMSGLEGRALYKRANNQCASLVGANCASDTMFNLASSAYSIMVTQDCNILEKTVNAKKENLMQTVKKAEQILREARLEEYRAHNSQDVNECLNKVEAAMKDPMVCGPNYEKCLDYTGLYINATTGEPISHQLFDLNKIAPVLGDVDVLENNPRWNEFLDSKQKFVVPALDTCRNLADDVWFEYKRTAMVRIAQMQDAKIEQFKNSCVQTIKECYNTNDGSLKDLTADALENTAYDVSATRAIAVRDVCYQNVLACAAMYGDADGCQYDPNTRKIVARKGAGKCGLSALLAYVDSVDTARIAQGCESTLIAKTHDMCDPTTSATTYTTTTTTTTNTSKAAKLGRVSMDMMMGQNFGYLYNTPINKPTTTVTGVKLSSFATLDDSKYPAGCKNWQLKKIQDELEKHAVNFCAFDLASKDTANVNSPSSTLNVKIIRNTVTSVYERLCMDLGYPSETCHGKYTAAAITLERLKVVPQQNAKDPIAKLMDDYNDKVESNKGAGYGDMGGFGNDKANVYLGEVLSPEQQAELRLTKGGDIIDKVGNIVDDYSMNAAQEALQTELLEQGLSEGSSGVATPISGSIPSTNLQGGTTNIPTQMTTTNNFQQAGP